MNWFKPNMLLDSVAHESAIIREEVRNKVEEDIAKRVISLCIDLEDRALKLLGSNTSFNARSISQRLSLNRLSHLNDPVMLAGRIEKNISGTDNPNNQEITEFNINQDIKSTKRILYITNCTKGVRLMQRNSLYYVIESDDQNVELYKLGHDQPQQLSSELGTTALRHLITASDSVTSAAA